jgi:hypothetical protein
MKILQNFRSLLPFRGGLQKLQNLVGMKAIHIRLRCTLGI